VALSIDAERSLTWLTASTAPGRPSQQVSPKQHFLDKRFEKALPKIDQLIDNENSVFSSSAFA
jgi:hypothetical protein